MVLLADTDNEKKKRNFTTIYMKKSLKKILDTLKVSESESYESVIERLVKNRTFNVINGNLVFTKGVNYEVRQK